MKYLNKIRRFLLHAIPLSIVCAFILGALVSGGLSRSGQAEKPGADGWFYEQRAYPLKEIPIGARVRAIEQLETIEARRANLRRGLHGESIEQSQPAWQALGPQPITNGNTGTVQRPVSGRATALTLDPSYDGVNNQTVYLGTAQGGLWRSRDNGATWTPLIDDQPSLAVGSLAIDPTNPNLIYVGTGEGNASGDSYYGAGLLKSIDGGSTWRVIRGPISATAPRFPVFQTVAISQIAIDPIDTQTVYLCTRTAATYGASGGNSIFDAAPGQRGVWKSTDGGENWRFLDPVGGNTTVTANDLIIDPQNPNTVYAALGRRGVFLSNAGGEPGTWTVLTNGLPTTNIDRIDLAIGPPLAPSTSPTVFAAMIVPGGSALNGIFRSTDNGNSWVRTNSNPSPVSQLWYNLILDVNPRDANILYFGGVTYFRSVDGGNTWINQANGNGNGNGGLHVDQHAQIISSARPNTIFVANDGGVWRSDNANTTTELMGWNNLNQTLNTVQFQSVGIHPTDPDFLLGGTQDNGTNRFTGNVAWTRVAGGDGGFALVDQTTPAIVWHTFQNSSTSTSASFGPEVSTNGGNSWTDRGCRNCTGAPGQMNPRDRVGFYAPLALNSGITQPANVVYFGTQRIYRTADLGVTWTGLGPSTDGFGQDLSKGAGRLSAIAAHPRLDNSVSPPGEIVWVGTSDGNVQVTTDAGKLSQASFTNVTRAPLPNRFVTDIGLDPNDTRRAYLTYSGFNISTPTTPGHIFTTTDFGATWRDISGDLPDVPVTSIAVDPTQSGILYLGTDIGVFQTTDGGSTWVRLSNGMPRVATFMVRYHAASRSLVAATHGRGMYRLKLANALTTVSAADFSRSALAVEGIAAAFGTGLATRTDRATAPLPTELAGTTVKVTDVLGVERPSPLFFVSPQQVNYQIPPETSPGAVTVTVTSGDGTFSFGIESVRLVAPSVFTANSNGRGVAAGVAVRVRNGEQTFLPIARLDSTQNPPQYVPEPIDLGPEGDQVVLVLFGSGVRKRSNLSAVRVSVGGNEIQPDYAAEAPGFVGLDQINTLLPRTLAGRGEVDVVVRVDGVLTNMVRLGIK